MGSAKRQPVGIHSDILDSHVQWLVKHAAWQQCKSRRQPGCCRASRLTLILGNSVHIPLPGSPFINSPTSTTLQYAVSHSATADGPVSAVYISLSTDDRAGVTILADAHEAIPVRAEASAHG